MRTCRKIIQDDGSVVILLNIDGKETEYALSYLDPHPEVAKPPAWRLTKRDGECFDLRLSEYGPVCECQDFQYRAGKRDGRCKHISALIALGIIK